MSDDEPKNCPICKEVLSPEPGELDQSGKPWPVTVWTCTAKCGYKRWDAYPTLGV